MFYNHLVTSQDASDESVCDHLTPRLRLDQFIGWCGKSWMLWEVTSERLRPFSREKRKGSQRRDCKVEGWRDMTKIQKHWTKLRWKLVSSPFLPKNWEAERRKREALQSLGFFGYFSIVGSASLHHPILPWGSWYLGRCISGTVTVQTWDEGVTGAQHNNSILILPLCPPCKMCPMLRSRVVAQQ